jgi:hypothetical protein
MAAVHFALYGVRTLRHAQGLRSPRLE